MDNATTNQPAEIALAALVALDAIEAGDWDAASRAVDVNRQYGLYHAIANRDVATIKRWTKYVVCAGCGCTVYGPQFARHEAGVEHEIRSDVRAFEARGLVRVLDACAERIKAAGGICEYGGSRYFPGHAGRVATKKYSHWSTPELATKHQLAPKKSKSPLDGMSNAVAIAHLASGEVSR